MSTPLKTLDLSPFTAGQSTALDITQGTGIGGVAWGLPGQSGPTLRLHNESGSGLQCSFNASGQGFYLPAGGWVDCQPSQGDTTLDIIILYVLPSPPVTLLLGTYYAAGESVPAMSVLGNSPIGIGGTVNTVGGTATAIQNDGNTSGTPIIEATATGAPSSNVKMDNAGNITIGAMIGGTLWKIFQTIANPPAASTEVLFGSGQNGNIVESRDLIQADAGVKLTAGGVAFTTGSMSKVVPFGPYTLSTTATFFNHNLGVVPDFIILTCVGTNSTAEMAKYDNTTMTTTQVKLVSNGSFSFIGLAIKF